MAIKPQITFDVSDPGALGQFWAAALGYVVQPPPDGFASWPEALTAWGVPEEDFNKANAIVDPDGLGPRLRVFFQPMVRHMGSGWIVVRDPEGNEFCVV